MTRTWTVTIFVCPDCGLGNEGEAGTTIKCPFCIGEYIARNGKEVVIREMPTPTAARQGA